MYCKKCGFKLSNEDTNCPFCNSEVEKPKLSYDDYVDFTQSTKKEAIRNHLGYVDLKTKWIHHLLIACAGYLVMNVAATLLMSILIVVYQMKGYDFSCVNSGSCPIETLNVVNRISVIAQVVAELLVILILVLIFRKHIKTFFSNFKKGKTFKWFGISFAIMYGFNFIYSIFLMMIDSTGSSTNQEGVNDILASSPLLGFLFVVIAAPLFEEIIFRLGVFRTFTHKNKKTEIIGLILTTIIFAGVHMIATFQAVFADMANPNWEILKEDALSIPIYLSGAFAMTFAYYKSKNLNSSILAHMTWNFIAFLSIISGA